jgi:hypothetical protein
LRIDRVKLIASALVLIVAATAVGAIYVAWFAPLTADQRIAATASTLTAGAFVVAVLAGIVAIRAYSDALRKPDLELTFAVGAGNKNRTTYQLTLSNTGQASAANAVVILRKGEDPRPGGKWINPLMGPGWNDTIGDIRWEAPPGRLIHPFILEYLPLLYGGPIGDEEATVRYMAVADGFGPITGLLSGHLA